MSDLLRAARIGIPGYSFATLAASGCPPRRDGEWPPASQEGRELERQAWRFRPFALTLCLVRPGGVPLASPALTLLWKSRNYCGRNLQRCGRLCQGRTELWGGRIRQGPAISHLCPTSSLRWHMPGLPSDPLHRRDSETPGKVARYPQRLSTESYCLSQVCAIGILQENRVVSQCTCSHHLPGVPEILRCSEWFLRTDPNSLPLSHPLCPPEKRLICPR